MPPKISKAWDHFEDKGEYIAKCEICKMNISFKSGLSNLIKHLQRKHTTLNLGTKEKKRQLGMKPHLAVPRIATISTDKNSKRSVAWDYFVKKDDYMGECNICKATISYKSGVSNLTKHIRRRHLIANVMTEKTEPLQEEYLQDMSDEEIKLQQSPQSLPPVEYKITINGKDTNESVVWDYFEDKGNYIARCSICATNISFKSGLFNLKKHIQMKHLTTNVVVEETEPQQEEYLQDSSDEDIKSLPSPQPSMPQIVFSRPTEKSRRRSTAWEYFVDKRDYTADCNICNANISYKSGVSNLTKHIQRRHRSINIRAQNTEVQHEQPLQDSSDEDSSEFRFDCSKSKKDSNKTSQSMAWKHFVNKGNYIGECNICKANISFKSGVSNLSKHFLRKHCTESVIVEETESQEEQPLHDSSDEEIEPPVAAASTSSWTDPAISEFLHRDCSKIKNDIDDHIMNFFLWDMHPFTIVEDNGFRALINFAFPNYVIPSRKYFANTLLSRQYDAVKTSIKTAVNEDAETVCLTTDMWTSRNDDTYLAVMGHYIDKNFVLQSILLECKVLENNEMGLNLAEELQNVVQDWNLTDRVLLLVSDNSEDIKNAITTLQWKHFICFSHTFNMAVQTALKCPALLSVINKVKAIISNTAHTKSNQAWNKLKKYLELANTTVTQTQRSIQDDVTRWNSTLYMLQGFVELKDEITSALNDKDETSLTLTSYEWGICESLILVLQPCEEVSKESCQKTFIGSMVLPITVGFTNALEQIVDPLFPDEVETCREDLLSEITTGFSNVENSKTFTTSTFLDPRFKLYFGNPVTAEQTKRHVIGLVTDLIDEENVTQKESGTAGKSRSLLWEHFNKILQNIRTAETPNIRATIEVERYIDDIVLSPNMNPLDWWRSNQTRYPHLAKLARSKLNLMPISVPCERMFSAAWNITERRYRTESNKVHQLLFLHHNKK